VAPSHTDSCSSKIARFGPFEADIHSAELFKNGSKIKIQEHSFQILRLLLEAPGEVITREELHRRLWPSGTFVDFDQGLNTAIMRLRHALDDSAEEPRFIETLPRHGYRFIAPVILTDDLAEPKTPASIFGFEAHAARSGVIAPVRITPEAAVSGLRSRVAAGLGAGLFLAISIAAVFNVRGIRDRLIHLVSAGPAQTLAVLPFDSLSGSGEQGYLAESMTEQLITDLGQNRGIRVLSRGSVMQFSGKHVALEEIARELHVDAVIEGSIVRYGDKVRVTANLYEVSSRQHLWADTYEREFGDGVTVQREIARDIAEKIRARWTPHVPSPQPAK